MTVKVRRDAGSQAAVDVSIRETRDFEVKPNRLRIAPGTFVGFIVQRMMNRCEITNAP